MSMPENHLYFILITAALHLLPLISSFSYAQRYPFQTQSFGPFNSTSYDSFIVEKDASINNQALQLTRDTINNADTLLNGSGRIILNKTYRLWKKQRSGGGGPNSTVIYTASFNTSFLVNIYRLPNDTAAEGLAFLIASSPEIPAGSEGRWLGLTNASLDGSPSNQFIAVELDTMKQDFDINDNHIGLDINGVRSVEAFNLSQAGVQIAPEAPANYTVWIDYSGESLAMEVYIANQNEPKPPVPVINRAINLSGILNQHSYFGFAASTGSKYWQLNCVLKWKLSVEILEQEGRKTHGMTVLLATSIPGAAVVFGAAVWLLKCWKGRSDAKATLGTTLKSLPGMPREFSYKDLKKATGDFDEKLKLGEGGFGVVFKGLLPKEKVEVAVKRFSRENVKGMDDFVAELSIINRLRHKHLVRLVGWCHKNERLLLVYDYMPNGSLDEHLFGPPEKTLSWTRRYNIVAGVASALHYLHDEYDQKVVHRDLKASNVLLDAHYNARLGDFGLARALDQEKTSYADQDNQGVPGTMGYIAPECFHTGKATRESDVYGLGAVILEVVCGRRPRCNLDGFHFLLDWVWKLLREGRILEAVDGRLQGDFDAEQAERLLKLGLACSHPVPRERPTAHAIVQILSGTLAPPYVPAFKPAFMWPTQVEADETSTATTSVPSSYNGSGWNNSKDDDNYSAV